MDDHITYPPPRASMEYSLAMFECQNNAGGSIDLTPHDVRSLRYCPFCGEELD
jgi:hypothetical protein